MHATEIQAHARRMRESLGDKAIAEAAQKAISLEQGGKTEEARTWRRIESALRMMSGPRES